MEELRNNFIHDIIDEDLKENPKRYVHFSIFGKK